LFGAYFGLLDFSIGFHDDGFSERAKVWFRAQCPLREYAKRPT
jgi:hypothetical protein